jgi:hypothetical protein
MLQRHCPDEADTVLPGSASYEVPLEIGQAFDEPIEVISTVIRNVDAARSSASSSEEENSYDTAGDTEMHPAELSGPVEDAGDHSDVDLDDSAELPGSVEDAAEHCDIEFSSSDVELSSSDEEFTAADGEQEQEASDLLPDSPAASEGEQTTPTRLSSVSEHPNSEKSSAGSKDSRPSPSPSPSSASHSGYSKATTPQSPSSLGSTGSVSYSFKGTDNEENITGQLEISLEDTGNERNGTERLEHIHVRRISPRDDDSGKEDSYHVTLSFSRESGIYDPDPTSRRKYPVRVRQQVQVVYTPSPTGHQEESALSIEEFMRAMINEDFTNSMSLNDQGSSQGSLDDSDSGASWRPDDSSSVAQDLANELYDGTSKTLSLRSSMEALSLTMSRIGSSQIELAPIGAEVIEAGRLLPIDQMNEVDEGTYQDLPPLYVDRELRARDLRLDQEDSSWMALLQQLDSARLEGIRSYTVYIRRPGAAPEKALDRRLDEEFAKGGSHLSQSRFVSLLRDSEEPWTDANGLTDASHVCLNGHAEFNELYVAAVGSIKVLGWKTAVVKRLITEFTQILPAGSARALVVTCIPAKTDYPSTLLSHSDLSLSSTDSEVFERSSSPVEPADVPPADQIRPLQDENTATVRLEATLANAKAKKFAELYAEERTARAAEEEAAHNNEVRLNALVIAAGESDRHAATVQAEADARVKAAQQEAERQVAEERSRVEDELAKKTELLAQSLIDEEKTQEISSLSKNQLAARLVEAEALVEQLQSPPTTVEHSTTMLQMIGLLEEDDGDHSGSDYGDSGDEYETSDEEHHSGSEADPLSDAESDEEERKFEFEPEPEPEPEEKSLPIDEQHGGHGPPAGLVEEVGSLSGIGLGAGGSTPARASSAEALAAGPSPSDSTMKAKQTQIQQSMEAERTALQTVVRVAIICHAPGPKEAGHSDMPKPGHFQDADLSKGAFPNSHTLHAGHRAFSSTSDEPKPGFYAIGVEAVDSDPDVGSAAQSTLFTLNLKGDFTKRPEELLSVTRQELFHKFGILVDADLTRPVPLDCLQFLAGPLTPAGVVDGMDGEHVLTDWVEFIDHYADTSAARPSQVNEVHLMTTLSSAALSDLSKASKKGSSAISVDEYHNYQLTVPNDPKYEVLQALVGTKAGQRTVCLTWMSAAHADTYGVSPHAPSYWPKPNELGVASATSLVSKCQEEVLTELASKVPIRRLAQKVKKWTTIPKLAEHLLAFSRLASIQQHPPPFYTSIHRSIRFRHPRRFGKPPTIDPTGGGARGLGALR